MMILILPSASANDRIVKYYQFINAAELAIVEGDIQAAIEQYASAYGLQGNDMASRHLHNYFIAAAETDNDALCRKLLLELRRREWDLDLYETEMKRIFKESKAKKMVALYESLGNVPSMLDERLLANVEALVKVDQQMNRDIRQRNNGLIEGEDRKIYRALTDGQMDTLAALFKDRFPSDKIIGTEGAPLYDCPYGIILAHNGMNTRPSPVLDSIFFIAVTRGEFDPVEFEKLLTLYATQQGRVKRVRIGDLIIESPLFPYDYVLLNDSLFEYQPKPEYYEKCASERKKIPGLAPIEDVRRKIIYQHFHPGKYGLASGDSIVRLDFRFPALYTKFKYIASFKD